MNKYVEAKLKLIKSQVKGNTAFIHLYHQDPFY